MDSKPSFSTDPAAAFEVWYAALEARQLERLRFPEVRKALQALSSLYVERRDRLGGGTALDSAGKRAAFALFYGPMHFLLVRGIVRELGAARPAPRELVDLGCGTGTAGAAWALEAAAAAAGAAAGGPAGPEVHGIERSDWALGEARWTYGSLGVRGRPQKGDAERAVLPGAGGAVLAAFVVNELEAAARDRLLGRLLRAGQGGARVLVVEPLSRRVAPWWDEWSAAFRGEGGRDDEWRLAAELPERLRLLDKAAGLRHDRLTGRSLYLPGRPSTPGEPS